MRAPQSRLQSRRGIPVPTISIGTAFRGGSSFCCVRGRLPISKGLPNRACHCASRPIMHPSHDAYSRSVHLHLRTILASSARNVLQSGKGSILGCADLRIS